ncbi:hypothetical protein MSAN_01213800 [Mycena sanguinolenta]|uniref:Uncharacterized protein n=1 Tax=Mycena sanguinolenta TaxID=230812 RepID=A0A8H6YFH4_9AGAR|nr:hypothetical protein MSAN_01213800 [Mycena sanguinolenta]
MRHYVTRSIANDGQIQSICHSLFLPSFLDKIESPFPLLAPPVILSVWLVGHSTEFTPPVCTSFSIFGLCAPLTSLVLCHRFARLLLPYPSIDPSFFLRLLGLCMYDWCIIAVKELT